MARVGLVLCVVVSLLFLAGVVCADEVQDSSQEFASLSKSEETDYHKDDQYEHKHDYDGKDDHKDDHKDDGKDDHKDGGKYDDHKDDGKDYHKDYHKDDDDDHKDDYHKKDDGEDYHKDDGKKDDHKDDCEDDHTDDGKDDHKKEYQHRKDDGDDDTDDHHHKYGGKDYHKDDHKDDAKDYHEDNDDHKKDGQKDDDDHKYDHKHDDDHKKDGQKDDDDHKYDHKDDAKEYHDEDSDDGKDGKYYSKYNDGDKSQGYDDFDQDDEDYSEKYFKIFDIKEYEKRKKNDAKLLQVALNLEFLEAEFFLHATKGYGLDKVAPYLAKGGPKPKGGQKARLSKLTYDIVQQFALQEVGHLRAIKKTLGKYYFSRPKLDISKQVFADLIDKAFGKKLDPPFDVYACPLNYFIGVYVIPYVGLTGYVGANPDLLTARYRRVVAGLLGVEAGQDAVTRQYLYERKHKIVEPYGYTVATFTNKISKLRNKLSRDGILDEGLKVPKFLGAEKRTYGNVLAANKDSLSYARKPWQIFSTVYGTGNASKPGGFYPRGAKGKIAKYFLKRKEKEDDDDYEKKTKDDEDDKKKAEYEKKTKDDEDDKKKDEYEKKYEVDYEKSKDEDEYKKNKHDDDEYEKRDDGYEWEEDEGRKDGYGKKDGYEDKDDEYHY